MHPTQHRSPRHAPSAVPARPCAVCGSAAAAGAVRFGALRPGLQSTLQGTAPSLDADSVVCMRCLANARLAYTTRRLEHDRGELSAVERSVAGMAAAHETMATHLDDELSRQVTRGQRLADAVARTGGSWPFVMGFGVFLLIWMVGNARAATAFDPYPFILLNLVLSCLAAIQAPVILMSQNRAAARDRAQADQDFRVNLKAELEVAALHEKVDHLLHARWEHLVELQELQLELLEQILREDSPAKPRDRP